MWQNAINPNIITKLTVTTWTYFHVTPKRTCLMTYTINNMGNKIRVLTK